MIRKRTVWRVDMTLCTNHNDCPRKHQCYRCSNHYKITGDQQSWFAPEWDKDNCDHYLPETFN